MTMDTQPRNVNSENDMTTMESRKLYIAAGGPPDHEDETWRSIHNEIEAVVAAKSDLAAGRTIDWWGCWDPKYTATAFARRVRKMHAENMKAKAKNVEQGIKDGVAK